MPLAADIAQRLIATIDAKFDGKPGRLARAAEISPGTFQRYIEGNSVPGGESLIKIAQAAGVSIDWLLTGGNVANYIQKKDGDIEPATPEEKKYVKKLLRILRSNDALMRNAIIPNLDAFDGRLITGGHTEKKRRAGNDK